MFSSTDISRYLQFSKRVSRMYELRIEQAAAACGITKPEADVLLFLGNSPQLDTARDACEYRGFSKAYVSKAVDLLCARGFLCAQVRRDDRRVQHLAVCPAAGSTVAQLQGAQQGFYALLSRGLTKADEQSILAVLARIAENITPSP